MADRTSALIGYKLLSVAVTAIISEVVGSSLRYIRPCEISVCNRKIIRVKMIKTNEGKMVEREWYLDDNGLLCQTLLSSGDLMCLAERDDFYAARSGSTVFTSSKGNMFEWTLDQGNPDNL